MNKNIQLFENKAHDILLENIGEYKERMLFKKLG